MYENVAVADTTHAGTPNSVRSLCVQCWWAYVATGVLLPKRIDGRIQPPASIFSQAFLDKLSSVASSQAAFETSKSNDFTTRKRMSHDERVKLLTERVLLNNFECMYSNSHFFVVGSRVVENHMVSLQ